MLIKRNLAGDTIVEVMIVLAVLGLSIGIAYATANRSLLNARQAQENAQATQLVQAQVEQLRTLSSITSSSDPDYIYQTTKLFCLNTSGGDTHVTKFVSSDTNPLSGNNYPDDYPAACVNSYYHLSIHDTGSDTFRVQAVWDDVTGQGQDKVTMVYKIHPL